MKKEVLNLTYKEPIPLGDILSSINILNIVSILKTAIWSLKLENLINHCLEKGNFPAELKITDFLLIFKKNNSLDKENYRPVSIFSNLLKVLYKNKFTISLAENSHLTYVVLRI